MSGGPVPSELPLVLFATYHEQDTRWLRSILESARYAVIHERSGESAIKRAQTAMPDLIIVETSLPDMTGEELCARLRADAKVAGSTPILIAFHESASREQRLNAFRSGAWDCIAPPHEADEILLKLGSFVRAKRETDQARTEGLWDSPTGLYNRQGIARRARELSAQAFREHIPIACVVLSLDAEQGIPTEAEGPTAARCAQVLRSSVRLSDVVGRLSQREFAVLTPAADPRGAKRLAARLADNILKDFAAVRGDEPPLQLRVRCGYDVVFNEGASPTEPVDLLVRAYSALRMGRAEEGDWLRRFDG
jgi:diguanylate cyclase (GGDEF)-like protein